jgi:hypothetical protein
MVPLSGNSRKRNLYYLPLLLIISIVSHFPFVLKGFGEIDATKIAVSVIDIIEHGTEGTFANFYFTDVIPLYVLYLQLFIRITSLSYEYLPVIMNYTNAAIGTLIVIPAFILVRRLFGNPHIAFCSVLSLIFAPSFYQSTIMGFPHLIAFFFLLIALCFFLTAIDLSENKTVYLFMALACIFLTLSFLFKSDYVLAAGTFIGFLFIRKSRHAGKIAGAVFTILIAGILFLIFRNIIMGPGSGTTMSKSALSDWYHYSLIIPNNFTYLIKQTKPIAYGAGLFTFFLGIILFFYYFLKRRFVILALVVSWAAVPTVFWIVMIGNNARHNMFTILPILVLITIFLYEKAPRYIVVLTALLIIGNFFITSPSSSILTPSGRLFASHAMLEDRMIKFHSSAKQIANINDNKIAVLGYFHNPHVVFELLKLAPSYEAFKIGREDYRIKTGDKEFVFIYFVVVKLEDMEENAKRIINKYDVGDYVFLSATYDLKTLGDLGLRTKSVTIIKKSEL